MMIALSAFLAECHRAFDSCLRHVEAYEVDLVTQNWTLLIPFTSF